MAAFWIAMGAISLVSLALFGGEDLFAAELPGMFTNDTISRLAFGRGVDIPETALSAAVIVTYFLMLLVYLGVPILGISLWFCFASGTTRNADVLTFLSQSFSQPGLLIKGMAHGNFVLSGSRALDYFCPGSCDDHSDWDFYTFANKFCIGRALVTLRQCGVEWDNVYKPFQILLEAPEKTVLVMHRLDLQDFLDRCQQEGFEPTAAIQEVLSDIRQLLDDDPWLAYIKVGDYGVLNIVRGRRAQSSHYYAAANTKINVITGHTTHNGTFQKVQLLYAKNRTPFDLIMAFYASHVQCFISAYGAVHFYYSAALHKTAYFWPANTQHRPSADSAMLKYNNRGWNFSRPPVSAATNRQVKQVKLGLHQNGSKLIRFSHPLGLAPQIEVARRSTFEHLAWQEVNGETCGMPVQAKDLRVTMSEATLIRQSCQRAGVVVLRERVEALLGLWYAVPLISLQSENKLPEELQGF